jgi:hypothetical protein
MFRRTCGYCCEDDEYDGEKLMRRKGLLGFIFQGIH